MSKFKPNIIAFVCNWCSYAGADKAGGQKLQYSAEVRLVRVMCSGRVSPQFVLDAFRKGADGVMVMGCHFGDCHYRNGNVKTYKRMNLLKKMLPQFGIDSDRLVLDWVAAGEAEKFQTVVNGMADKIRVLGELKINGFVPSVSNVHLAEQKANIIPEGTLMNQTPENAEGHGNQAHPEEVHSSADDEIEWEDDNLLEIK